MFTLVSRRVRESMLESASLSVMFHLFATCNRSAPHQRVVGHALRTLAQLGGARRGKKAAAVGDARKECDPRLWTEPKPVLALVDLVQSYREHPALLSDALDALEV